MMRLRRSECLAQGWKTVSNKKNVSFSLLYTHSDVILCVWVQLINQHIKKHGIAEKKSIFFLFSSNGSHAMHHVTHR